MVPKDRDFGSLKEEHPRVNLDFLDKVLSTVEQMSSKKMKSTVTMIAVRLGVKRGSVKNALNWLVKYHYVKPYGSSTKIVFFKISSKDKDVKFEFGRVNIQPHIEEMLDLLGEHLKKNELDELILLKEENLGKFFHKSKKYIETIWEKIPDDIGLKLIEFNTKPIVYVPFAAQ